MPAVWRHIAAMVMAEIKELHPEWEAVPYQVKRTAVRDACRAMSNVKRFNAQLKADQANGLRLDGSFAELHFRSRKNPRQSCYIPDDAVTEQGVYHTILGPLRMAEAVPAGQAVAAVVSYAREAGKPIVIEKLDFRHKKAVLEGESRRYSRMLSSFSYGKIKTYFLSRGYRQGVEIHQVNPAFSSVIGRVKFMERYGLSVHQAAALVLARRLLGCSERIPRRRVCPLGNGVQVAFTVPARKRVKHVWTYWGAISGQLRPALAAQHRLGRRGRRPNPVQAAIRGKTRVVA